MINDRQEKKITRICWAVLVFALLYYGSHFAIAIIKGRM